MKRVKLYLDKLYDDVITQEFDRIIPIVGDEGMGKSTFIIQLMWFWEYVLGREPEIDAVLDQIVWDNPDEFKLALSEAQPRTMITVMDATRVLHKKQAMDRTQIDLEKDLFDVRMKENVILLGYQDWGTIPTVLQERRAKNMFYIPKRGTVYGYNRKSMNEKVEMDGDEWPEPDMTDTFPSLEGKQIWRRFKELDLKHKQERIKPEEDDDGLDNEDLKELADKIVNEEERDIDHVVSIHGGHNKPYIDAGLIEIEYDLSSKEANLVKKLVAREVQFA